MAKTSGSKGGGCGPTRRNWLGGAMALSGIMALDQRLARAAGAEDPGLPVDRITLPTARQPLVAHVVKPRAEGARPAVLVMPERSQNINVFIKIAQRLARAGFLAVVPDFTTAYGIPSDAPPEAREAFAKVPAGEIVPLLQQVLDHLPRMPNSNGAVGIVSFQWGGSITFPFLSEIGRLKAAVAFDLAVDKPAQWDGLVIPVQLHVPEMDHTLAGQADNNEKRLMGRGKIYEQYIYPGALASFALEAASKRYSKSDADLAFDRMIQFFHRRLG